MAGLDIMNLFFNGREEFLRVLKANESIVKNLSDVKNPVCPLIGTDITLGKELGKGMFGAVFEIEFPNRGRRKYVAKRAQVEHELLIVYSPHPKFSRWPRMTFEGLQNTYQVSAKVIIDYNRLTALPTDEVSTELVIPLFKKGCTLQKEEEIPRLDGQGMTVFLPGDYICETVYSEFSIAVLVGEIYRTEQSINFLDTFYFASCITGNSLTDVMQYTFMEKIDKSLRRTIGCISETGRSGVKNPNYNEEIMNCVVVQIIHAIGVYQEKYQIVHGDLHDDNVFLEFVTDDTMWKGQKVLDVDYYQYVVKGENIYLPGGKLCPLIVKIGDWGLACKYSTPKIAETTTLRTGYNQWDGEGPWLPNFYTRSYDVFFILDILYKLNPSNEFIQNIMAWMLGLPKVYTNKMIEERRNEVFPIKPVQRWTTTKKGKQKMITVPQKRNRPSMESLNTILAHVSPLAILSNRDLMDKYLQSPAVGEGIVLIMGEI